jgi:hypothetical protein
MTITKNSKKQREHREWPFLPKIYASEAMKRLSKKKKFFSVSYIRKVKEGFETNLDILEVLQQISDERMNRIQTVKSQKILS